MPTSYTIWPNGEACVFRERKKTQVRFGESRESKKSNIDKQDSTELPDRNFRVRGVSPLGLSNLRNFSKINLYFLTSASPMVLSYFTVLTVGQVKGYGLKGITSYGRRMVRNACYVLERTVRHQHLSFVTLTIPSVPDEVACCIAKNWGKVVDSYIRAVRRRLSDKGVSPEVVYVTEIQAERYETANYPPLHLHLCFIGRRRGFRGWVISPAVNDRMWIRALKVGIRAGASPEDIEDFCTAVGETVDAACQIAQVRKSCASYMGKYMSKGVGGVKAARKRGHGDLLPGQWWGCSRGLQRKIKEVTVKSSLRAEHLFYDFADGTNKGLWRYSRHVFLGENNTARVATYGWLHTAVYKEYIENIYLHRGESPPVSYLELCGSIPKKALSER